MTSERTIIFGINEYEKFSNEISTSIIKTIFPNISPDHYKMLKIHQNIALVTIAIIGATLSESIVEKLKKECINRYLFSLVSPGDMVGVTAAQSVSQPITQAVLKSQHSTGKKQSGSSTSLLSLNRLKVSKNTYKVHLLNGQIPSISKAIFTVHKANYINEIKHKIVCLEKILSDRIEKKYSEITNFFLNDEIETLKINIKNQDKLNALIKKSKEPVTYEAASRFLGTIKLEFEHSFDDTKSFTSMSRPFGDASNSSSFTGSTEQKRYDIFETTSSIPAYRFRLNFELWIASKNLELTKDYLLYEHEELKIEDFITSSCGKCKYTKVSPDEFYDQNENFVYINHHPVAEDCKIFRFTLDSAKIKNSKVNYLSIINMLFDIPSIMIVVHPLSKFCFDLVQGDKSENIVKDAIDLIMRKKVKGISGLEYINDVKIEVSDLTRFQFYDKNLNETHVFLNQRNLLYFPIEELHKRIVMNEGSKNRPAKMIRKCINSSERGILKLVYQGEILIKPIPYFYFDYSGSITFDLIREKLAKNLNIPYFISANHNEMIEKFGKVAARAAHESYYMDELISAGSPLSHQNVSLICRHIFSFNLRPITPAGFLKTAGINIIDKFCFQNHEANLTDEILHGKPSKTNGIINSVFFGKKAKLGTNYVSFRVNGKIKKQVDEEIADAKTQQKYSGKYKGVHFPDVGVINSLTVLNFGNNFSVNNLTE